MPAGAGTPTSPPKRVFAGAAVAGVLIVIAGILLGRVLVGQASASALPAAGRVTLAALAVVVPTAYVYGAWLQSKKRDRGQP